jgi:hypothetical protein
MATSFQRPRGAASNVDYWLRRCEGFRVDSPQGPVGFVEEVRYASRLDRPDVIAVRAGFLGRLLVIVPVGEIAEILPRHELTVLHRSPRPNRGSARGSGLNRSSPSARAEPPTARWKALELEASASKPYGR